MRPLEEGGKGGRGLKRGGEVLDKWEEASNYSHQTKASNEPFADSVIKLQFAKTCRVTPNYFVQTITYVMKS